ncbi:MAG: hypothetical protein MUF52_16845 [Syntrophobacteraceae bacterium]|jgi:hypothetical protein|nr:hypothetical protein [Syntrophobacteraceae bacterium]
MNPEIAMRIENDTDAARITEMTVITRPLDIGWMNGCTLPGAFPSDDQCIVPAARETWCACAALQFMATLKIDVLVGMLYTG